VEVEQMRDVLVQVWTWYWGLPVPIKIIIAAIVAAALIEVLR
jgi:hypothetical protein